MVLAAPVEEGDYDLVLKVIETFMPRVGDPQLETDRKKVVSSIAGFWRTNVASFEKIMASSPETHATILGIWQGQCRLCCDHQRFRQGGRLPFRLVQRTL